MPGLRFAALILPELLNEKQIKKNIPIILDTIQKTLGLTSVEFIDATFRIDSILIGNLIFSIII